MLVTKFFATSVLCSKKNCFFFCSQSGKCCLLYCRKKVTPPLARHCSYRAPPCSGHWTVYCSRTPIYTGQLGRSRKRDLLDFLLGVSQGRCPCLKVVTNVVCNTEFSPSTPLVIEEKLNFVLQEYIIQMEPESLTAKRSKI